MVEVIVKDLIGTLLSKCSLLEAILYGSYARGDARGKSDIDLLLIVKDNPKECESHALEIASSLRIPLVQPIALTMEEIRRDRDKQALYLNALLEGLLIYHSLDAPLTKSAPPGYEPCVLIRYRARKNVLKKLVGTTVSYKGYRVRARGLIEKLGGKRIAPGLLIVPMRNVESLEHILNYLGVDYVIIGYVLANMEEIIRWRKYC